MKILITGAKGFTATYLIDFLKKNIQNELYFTDIKKGHHKNWYLCDLTDFNSTYDLLAKTMPKYVYNLAGSFSNDYEIDYRINVLATRNILESILKLGINCRILLIGSSAEYGMVSERDNPINEEHLLNPVTIYGVTKVFQTYLMNYYSNVKNMDVLMARTFNLLGEGVSDELFIGRLYKQIREYKKDNIKKITLANLKNKRDYIDVKEAVKYYELIIKYGSAGEIYNVGSGKSIKISDLLDNILKDNGLKMDIVKERVDYSTNKYDIRDIFADIGKLLQLTKCNSFHNN